MGFVCEEPYAGVWGAEFEVWFFGGGVVYGESVFFEGVGCFEVHVTRFFIFSKHWGSARGISARVWGPVRMEVSLKSMSIPFSWFR